MMTNNNALCFSNFYIINLIKVIYYLIIISLKALNL